VPKFELKMKLQRIAAVFFACVLALATIVPASAPSTAYGTGLQQRVRDASARIGEMEESVATAVAALEEASAELQETEAEIAEAEEIAEELENSIAVNQEALSSRASFMYRTDNMGHMRMLFSARSFSEFTATFDLINAMANNDAQTIKDLRVETAQLEEVLSSLEDLQEQQQAAYNTRRTEADNAQTMLNEQQSYIRSLNTQIQEQLQRQQDEANRQAATSPGAASGSNRPAGGGGGSGGTYIGTGTTFTGIASWYQIGTRTANGEAFNPDAMTAAHQTLPFGTLVRVTFRGNSVVVRINDRGPFTGGRIIDLSRGAAAAIGLKSAGIGTVTMEIVHRP